MIKPTIAGKIFLADQRGLHETAMLRRWSTLNFGAFNDPTKTAENRLYFFNDDSLAAKQKTCFEVAYNSYLVILPITGTVNYLDDTENETDVEVEEAIVVYLEKGANVTLSNNFEDHIINYLCIGLRADDPMPNNPQYFDFKLGDNKLIKLERNFLPFSIHIGRFDGRKSCDYPLSPTSTTFSFVITGAFEIEGRLLHEKDALTLTRAEKIELEALSNDAVLLLVELNA